MLIHNIKTNTFCLKRLVISYCFHKGLSMKRYLVIIGNDSLLTRLREKISKGRVIYDKSRM